MTLATLEPHWDALVVGAGVGGSTLAALLARRGWKVLLLDRALFPRQKICGCCLSPATVLLLQHLGLDGGLEGAAPLREARIAVQGRQYIFPHGGASLSRARLDQQLSGIACREGAVFLCGAAASDGGMNDGWRQVSVRCGDLTRTLHARLVIAADGIGGRFAQSIPSMRWAVARHSRLGVAALLPAGAIDCPVATVVLAVGYGGYAGVVRLEDGAINVAAAVEPAIARDSGGPGQLVAQLLRQGGIAGDVSSAIWHGTPLLTRRRGALGAPRLLAVGDACAYEEPFTGEGMKWAALGAASLASLLGARQAEEWHEALPLVWQRRHRQLLGKPLSRCRMVSRLLRHPSLFSLAMRALRPLADGIMGGISRLPPEHAYCPEEVCA